MSAQDMALWEDAPMGEPARYYSSTQHRWTRASDSDAESKVLDLEHAVYFDDPRDSETALDRLILVGHKASCSFCMGKVTALLNQVRVADRRLNDGSPVRAAYLADIEGHIEWMRS